MKDSIIRSLLRSGYPADTAKAVRGLCRAGEAGEVGAHWAKGLSRLHTLQAAGWHQLEEYPTEGAGNESLASAGLARLLSEAGCGHEWLGAARGATRHARAAVARDWLSAGTAIKEDPGVYRAYAMLATAEHEHSSPYSSNTHHRRSICRAFGLLQIPSFVMEGTVRVSLATAEARIAQRKCSRYARLMSDDQEEYAYGQAALISRLRDKKLDLAWEALS